MYVTASGLTRSVRGVRADDCQRVFGSRKNMQYVGQDEIIESPGTRVANRALANFFTGFSRMAGRCASCRTL